MIFRCIGGQLDTSLGTAVPLLPRQSADQPMDGSEPDTHRRRAFFRETLSRILEPLAKHLDREAGPAPSPKRLRPPGAIREPRLIETCYRCGVCIEVCPMDAILPLPDGEGEAAGTPVINPDKAACGLCDGLKCTTSCPSGALTALAAPQDARMGIAELYDPLCIRTDGNDCTLCLDYCPLGEAAIRVGDEGLPEILFPGCVGCGMCQLHCPTTPKAIVVRPRP